MKQVTNVNIAGLVFTIDQDAYLKLGQYLDSLKSHFGNNEEGQEIVSDIEARIAELFFQRDGGPERVVNISDVDAVINQLGSPETIAQEDAGSAQGAETSQNNSEPKKSEKKKRKLFRSTDDCRIGGICGGLGVFFNIDPILFRIGFVVLFLIYGIGLIPYILFWILIPKADTTAKKLQMNGEDVNAETISNHVREHSSQESNHPNFFWKLVKIFILLIGVLILIPLVIFLLIVVFAIPLAIFGALFTSGFTLATVPLSALGSVSLLFVLFIPAIATIWLVAKLLFGRKNGSWTAFLSVIAVWVVSLVMVVILGYSGSLFTSRDTHNKVLSTIQSKIRHEIREDDYELDELSELDDLIEDVQDVLRDLDRLDKQDHHSRRPAQTTPSASDTTISLPDTTVLKVEIAVADTLTDKTK